MMTIFTRYTPALIAAIFVFSWAVANALGHLVLAPYLGSRLVADHWGWIVLFQLAAQVGVAAIAHYAAGGVEDNQARSLTIFGVALAGLAAVWDVPFRWFLGESGSLEVLAKTTLLANLVCRQQPGQCTSLVGGAGLTVSLLLLASCIGAAFLMRRTANSERVLPIQSTLALIAVTANVFAFLLIHEWSGDVVDAPFSPSLLPSNPSELVAEPDFFAPLVWATIAAVFMANVTLTAVWLWGGPRSQTTLRKASSTVFGFLTFFLDLLLLLLAFAAILALAFFVSGVSSSIFSGLYLAVTYLAAVCLRAFSDWASWLATNQSLPVLDAVPQTPQAASSPIELPNLQTGLLLVLAAGALVGAWFARHWIKDALIYCIEWVLHAVARRWGWLSVLMLSLGTCAWLNIAPPLSPPASRPEEAETTYEMVEYPEHHSFFAASIDCSRSAASSRLRWSFDSSDNLSISASGCRIDVDAPPALVVAVGMASSDTALGGFELSVARANSIAAVAHQQFPDSGVIVAALGRERTGRSMDGEVPDLSAFGRPAMVLISNDVIPAPMKRAPLSADVDAALSSLLSRYETCWIATYPLTRLPSAMPYPVNQAGCRWAN